MALLSRSYEHNVMMRHEKICKLQISNVSIGQVRSDIWAVAGPPVPGSAIISRGKAPGRVLLSGGVKRKKSPPPRRQKHVQNWLLLFVLTLAFHSFRRKLRVTCCVMLSIALKSFSC